MREKRKPLRICLVASELAPLAKTGGLADVTAALSTFLHEDGHDVRVLIPHYSRINRLRLAIKPVEGLTEMSIGVGTSRVRFAIDEAVVPGKTTPVYLLRCAGYYGRSELYTQDADEHLRFMLLSRAAIEMCQRMQFAPHIISCHDWQAALIPLYLRTVYAWDRLFEQTRSVLTIHNIGYQGVFPAHVLGQLVPDTARQYFHSEDLKEGVVNFLKTGILYAHLVTTVSPSYAREILGDDYGMGLNHLLRQRMHSVVGILNGVDYREWNPATDRKLPARYSPDDMRGKAVCKSRLQLELGISEDPDRPLIGIVSRLVGQKGMDLVQSVLPRMLTRRDFALVVLGTGEPRLESRFKWMQQNFAGRVAFHRGFNDKLAHWIEAGSDIFLMPSLYEPCGLNQMYSLKYGTVPIVRETGGLQDSVVQFDGETGTGIVFRDFDERGLEWAVDRALDLYADKPAWSKLVSNGMAQDFSWQRQGARYVELFRELSGVQ